MTSLIVEKESTIKEEAFDGILCFGGEDWWYHNRGHYDMQMMREFSHNMPVLYVNSIGVRAPFVSEGKMFFKRITRKLKSFKKGLVHIGQQMHVYSPITSPNMRKKPFGKWFLAAQLKRTLKKLNIKKPLIWVACPSAIEVFEFLDYAGLVYQRTDKFEAFRKVNSEKMVQYDRALKAQADITLFCTSSLYDNEKGQCKNAQYVDHGVDFDYFFSAAKNQKEPEDVAKIAHPRIGFIGGIDPHTFDPELFIEVVRKCPELNFVMVGASTMPEDWCEEKNVYFLGQKDYSQVADYMASCDILTMPWNKSDWIMACNPIKLKEYMAIGKPIVSTFFNEAVRYENFIDIVRTADDFASSLKKYLNESIDGEAMQERVRQETWQNKYEYVVKDLSQRGIVYQ